MRFETECTNLNFEWIYGLFGPFRSFVDRFFCWHHGWLARWCDSGRFSLLFSASFLLQFCWSLFFLTKPSASNSYQSFDLNENTVIHRVFTLGANFLSTNVQNVIWAWKYCSAFDEFRSKCANCSHVTTIYDGNSSEFRFHNFNDVKSLPYLASIAIREKVAINLLKFFHWQMSAWAIFQESFVPFLYFGIWNITMCSYEPCLFSLYAQKPTGEFRILFQIL